MIKRYRHIIIAVAVGLAAFGVVKFARSNTSLRVRYHMWRLESELGKAQERPINALAQIGPAAVPALREALSSPRFATRLGAAKALAEIESPQADAALVVALKDENGDVRFVAVWGLLGSEDPALLPSFRAALKDERADVRRMALYGFIAYPPETAMNELIEALKSDDETLQHEAAMRLGDFSTARVMDTLFEKLADDAALAAGARLMIDDISGEDPGPELADLLHWWAENKDRFVEEEAEPDQ